MSGQQYTISLPNGDVIAVTTHQDHLVFQSTNDQHIIGGKADPHGIKVWLE